MNEPMITNALPATVKTNGLAPVLPESKPLMARYVWKTGKTFFPSLRETAILEAFTETRNFNKCVERVKQETGREVSLAVVRLYLAKDHVHEWLRQYWEEKGIMAGWTKEHWFKVMTDHLKANAEYDAAKDELKMYEAALDKRANDPDAITGLPNARKNMQEASAKRLGVGDLYAMNLIGKFKGWEVSNAATFNQQILITQADGRA